MSHVFTFIITTLFFGYIGICLFMFQKQDEMLYSPKKVENIPVLADADNAQIITVKTEDGISLNGWYFPAQKQMPTIVFFHGNSFTISDTYSYIKSYVNDGYGLLMIEYREYAGHEGKFSERGAYSDARAFLSWLYQQDGINPDNTVYYGESLGSAIAIEMAKYAEPRALILLSSFSSILDVTKQQFPYLPIWLILRDKYLNDIKIKNVNCPVLILHGGKDVITPLSFAEKLHQAANEPKKMIVYEQGTHINLYSYGAYNEITKFIKDNYK